MSGLLLRQAHFKVFEATRRMGKVQRAVSRRLALDIVGCDPVEYLVRRPGKRMVQRLTNVATHRLFNRVGRQPKPGIDQPHIAPGPTIANCPGLKKRDTGPGFGGRKRRGTAGKTAAHNQEINFNIAT